MTRLPRGCSYELSKLEKESNILSRIFYDKEGNEIHRISMRVPRGINRPTKCPYSPIKSPTKYHRWYYRNVRRHRDGREPRKSDFEEERLSHGY